jgi:formylglycine-generating enzyme required for sulfatase activity
MPSPPEKSRPRHHVWFASEQLAVTIVLLVVFALAWRYGDPARRAARIESQNAATRASAPSTGPQPATAPGFGRHEVATRPFNDLREVTNSIGMTLREVPRTLGMVGNADDPDGDALPRIVKTDPFFIATTEVTRGQWKKILGAFRDPSIYINEAAANDDLPVNNVDYPDAVRFCKVLSAREGRNYRLPTEYEWEIACWGRRNHAIFAARAAMKLAAVVASDTYEKADAKARLVLLDTATAEAINAARDDLVRLGYDESRGGEDAAAFAAARAAIEGVKARVLAALEEAPTPRDGSARRSRVYDAVLPNVLAELQHASYAGGPSAAAARFEDNSAEAWTRYGQYQATWWRGRESRPKQDHPLGLQDMLGGMMEWTATPSMPYPYAITLKDASAADVNGVVFDEANIPMSRWATLDELPRFAFNRTLADKTFYIVRGGSFERAVESCTPWNRYGQLPLRTRFTAHRESLGFRVVLEP